MCQIYIIFIPLYQATAIGNNAQSAHALLKSEYVETLKCEEGRELILKILRKSMDKTQLMPENIEMLEINKDLYSQNVIIRMLTRDEIHAACSVIRDIFSISLLLIIICQSALIDDPDTKHYFGE